MEGKNESKHTPGKWFVELGSGSLPYRIMTTLDNTLVAATSDNLDASFIASAPALLEENERLKILAGNRLNVANDQEREIKELRAEVDRLTKEQDMQQKALDWDRYKKHLAEQKVQTLESEAIRLRERHNKHGIAYSKLKTENDRLTKEKSEAIEALKAFVIDIEGHPSYAAREHYKPIMDKAKDLLTRIK